jgi:uncharacterized protein
MAWIAIAVAAVFTSALSGALGMAGGFLLLGVCTALLPLAPAMIAHGVTQAVSNGSRFVLLRGHVAWRGVAIYALGALAAAAFAVFAALRVSPAVMHLVLGSIPFAALAMRGRVTLRFEHPAGAAACGAAVTLTQLVAGVSGPLLDAFFVASPLDRFAVVATKAATQTLAHLVKIAYFTLVAGMARGGDAPPLWALALCACAALAGTLAGRRVLDRLDDASFRKIGNRLLLVMGAGHIVWGVVLVSR